MVDHIIFDLDGTLVDSAAICSEILNSMLEERGAQRTILVDEAKPFMSRGGTHMISGLLAEHCSDPNVDLAHFRERYAQLPTPGNCLFEGVRAGLDDLVAHGFRLSICSNKPQNLCDKVLGDLGLADLFDVVVGTRPGLRSKPHPDLIDETFSQLRTGPERCLFVGDSDLDEAIAQAAGVPFLFVTYGYADEEWCTDGLTRFDLFTDLVSVVKATYAAGQPLRRVA